MNSYVATIINAILLIILSGWAYFSAQTSFTALIPAGFGIVLLCLAPGLRAARKLNLYLTIFLTALIIVALLRPLSTTLQSSNVLGTVRTAAMIVSSLGALIVYVTNIIKQRHQSEQ